MVLSPCRHCRPPCTEHESEAKEWFYGSIPNFSLTKPPVLKPARPRPYHPKLGASLTIRTSSFDSPPQKRKYVEMFSSHARTILPLVEQPRDAR